MLKCGLLQWRPCVRRLVGLAQHRIRQKGESDRSERTVLTGPLRGLCLHDEAAQLMGKVQVHRDQHIESKEKREHTRQHVPWPIFGGKASLGPSRPAATAEERSLVCLLPAAVRAANECWPARAFGEGGRLEEEEEAEGGSGGERGPIPLAFKSRP